MLQEAASIIGCLMKLWQIRRRGEVKINVFSQFAVKTGSDRGCMKNIKGKLESVFYDLWVVKGLSSDGCNLVFFFLFPNASPKSVTITE